MSNQTPPPHPDTSSDQTEPKARATLRIASLEMTVESDDPAALRRTMKRAMETITQAISGGEGPE